MNQENFNEFCQNIFKSLSSHETLFLYIESENSTFVRFNKSQIRQGGSVEQKVLTATYISQNKQQQFSMDLSSNPEQDLQFIQSTLDQFRQQTSILPEDPFLVYSTEPSQLHDKPSAQVFSETQICEDVLEFAASEDFVGFLGSGQQYTGLCSSLGHNLGFSRPSFCLDWSLYFKDDIASKGQYSGSEWSRTQFEAELKKSQSELQFLKRDPITLKPGQYRIYLAPDSVGEIINLLAWGGFSGEQYFNKTSVLQKLYDKKISLSPMLDWQENRSAGQTPQFDELGFVFNKDCQLVKGGQFSQALVSPRTAKEHQVEYNSDSSESIYNFQMKPGQLPINQVLQELGTGLYIGNLWYLDYSDWNQCRMTGMTRYGCFWVEGGEIQNPFTPMRFDASLFDFFGNNLEGLTDKTTFIADPSTYYKRSNNSLDVPGALVNDFTLTL